MNDGIADRDHNVRAIVVDDEAHVRSRITDLLNGFSMIDVVGECGDGVQAVEMIATRRPDLAFLDIQMPHLDGFDVINSLDSQLAPIVVFVTAFDEHAIKAFDVNAVDYVLKPIDESRFATAVARALNRIEAGRAQINTVVQSVQRPCRRLLVKKNDSQIVIKTQDIQWIEAADKYVRLHTDSSVYISRQTMRQLEAKLDPDDFIRIHRSVIVNIAAVQEIQTHFHGELRVVISDGTALPLGRTYRQMFNERFHGS